MEPKLILVNPWIYDFAAYDLWSKPLGLLYIAGYLRQRGYGIHMIDCLDIHHPEMADTISGPPPVRRYYGTGKFWKSEVEKPSPLKHINRTYSRYGIKKQFFVRDLKKVERPSAILVTSLMTYWYPGVREAISIAREVHPDVPVILGGIYARLCRKHARESSGADYIAGNGGLGNPEYLLELLGKTGVPVPRPSGERSELPFPAFDLLHGIDYVCILTSTGCPYSCRYCASRFLNPAFFRRNPRNVIEEIRYWHEEHGVLDFAFYDDALLVDSGRHITVILEEIMEKNLSVRFHTPNALHVKEISPDIAKLLFQAGFRTIRLGLETSDIAQHANLDNKVSEGDFENAVHNLRQAGYDSRDIGAYILMGLPGQSVDSVIRSIKFIEAAGASPYPAEYSPLPHTSLWEKAVAQSSYDLSGEPLFHNCSLLPCWDESKKRRVPELKALVREIRKKLK